MGLNNRRTGKDATKPRAMGLLGHSGGTTSHLRPPMEFLSHNSSDTPGLAPLMNVLFWGRCDFPISFSGRDMSRERFTSSLRKFYGRYDDRTKQYEVPLSRMLHKHSGWWPHTVTPFIDKILHRFLTVTDLDLITEFDFYLIVQSFHKSYATGVACQQRTLTPLDTWFCSTLGLACVLMSTPISLELVLSPDFWMSNIPGYFSFTSDNWTEVLFQYRMIL